MIKAWLFGLLIFSGWHSAQARMPSYEQVREGYESSDAKLLDRHGEVLYRMRLDKDQRRLSWVSLQEIPQVLQEAVLRSEDRRFYRHSGIDWRAVLAALRARWSGKGRRGASTLSMQLASLLSQSAPRAGRRGWWDKTRQVFSALALESRWSKEQIFEAYLNLVPLRGELLGVHAAARGLFNKDVHGLDTEESLILAALLRSPAAAPQLVAQRACWLARGLGSSTECAQTETSDLGWKARQALTQTWPIRSREGLAPHVAWQLFPRSEVGRESAPGGARVLRSTLDAKLQAAAQASLRTHLAALKKESVADGAVLVVDNLSGEVLAYVGSNGDQSSRPHVDGVRAFRQAGSTLKPFLYASAFEKKLLTPLTRLDDSPLDVMVGNGVYRPRNYDKLFRGLVEVREALASSMNVPAVLTLDLLGTQPFLEKLGTLGFKGLRSAEHYGYSLALGSVSVRLWDLVGAYRTLAQGGLSSPLHLREGLRPAPTRVFSQEAAFQVGDILSDRQNRAATFGLENPLATRFWSAVKTGTTKDMRDNWCVGFTRHYTVGVWVGNFDGSPMRQVSGTSGAAPVWQEMVALLETRQPSRAPAPPKGLVHVGKKTQGAWVLEGTEELGDLSQAGSLLRQAPVKISYPPDGLFLAFDPETPAESRVLFLESSRPTQNLRWWLERAGQEDIALGVAAKPLPFVPGQGPQVLALRNSDGESVDQVRIHVVTSP